MNIPPSILQPVTHEIERFEIDTVCKSMSRLDTDQTDCTASVHFAIHHADYVHFNDPKSMVICMYCRRLFASQSSL